MATLINDHARAQTKTRGNPDRGTLVPATKSCGLHQWQCICVQSDCSRPSSRHVAAGREHDSKKCRQPSCLCSEPSPCVLAFRLGGCADGDASWEWVVMKSKRLKVYARSELISTKLPIVRNLIEIITHRPIYQNNMKMVLDTYTAIQEGFDVKPRHM